MNKGLKWIDNQPVGKICVFRSFKTHKSSILKQLEIEIAEVTQDS